MRGISSLLVLTTIALALLLAWAAHALGAPWSAALLASLGGLVVAFGAVAIGPPASPARMASPAGSVLDPSGADAAPGPDLDELIDAIDDPCLIVVNRRVTRANPAARELLGEHIVGEDVRLAIRHPAAAERLIGPPAVDNGETRSAIELVGIGERERRWELIVHDLSKRGRFVRLADRSRTHAAEKMRVDFVANASHELRTPLASLLGYIETLQDVTCEDEETRTRFLGIMHGQAIRMQRLINDLISLSRIEGEKYRLPGEDVDLAPLIDDASEAACAALREDSARIVVTHDANIGHIMGDRAQLSQLVSNLVANALKYGRQAGPVRVTTSIRPDDMIRLVVEDEGEGVAPELLPRLTERFFRVDASRSRAMGGTGLGLAIVKHIVERHRGRLSIESKLGEGTSVTIDLPANHGHLSSRRHEAVIQPPGERDGIPAGSHA